MFNGAVLNPAYAGAQTQFVATGIHRSQWINIEGAPSTNIASIHSGFNEKRFGLGLMVINEEIGVHTDNGLFAQYSYHIPFPFAKLSLGIQGGFNNIRSDFDRLNILNPNDPSLSGSISEWTPNFGTGAYLHNKHFFAGISIPFLLTENVFDTQDVFTDARMRRSYFLTGGMMFDLHPSVKLVPSALIRHQYGQAMGFDLNTNVVLDDRVTLGASYRTGRSLVALFMLQANDNFSFGYAYDHPFTDLVEFTGGSHEIMISYRINTGFDKCYTYF